jgi:hypothetical protein
MFSRMGDRSHVFQENVAPSSFPACVPASTLMKAMPELGDLELLHIEIETLWPPDARGRIQGRECVIASSVSGLGLAVGNAVSDDLATELQLAVRTAASSEHVNEPPRVLEECQRILGNVELTASSGPSFLVPDGLTFRSEAVLVRSDEPGREALRAANPGNWTASEWQQLIDGALGPWAMATQDGQVIAICHTPVSNDRAAEAGVWTHAAHRGRGHAAAVTAAWAALLRPSGRLLFYSTSRTNHSSQRVAARLGLRPIGWLWQLARRARTKY